MRLRDYRNNLQLLSSHSLVHPAIAGAEIKFWHSLKVLISWLAMRWIRARESFHRLIIFPKEKAAQNRDSTTTTTDSHNNPGYSCCSKVIAAERQRRDDAATVREWTGYKTTRPAIQEGTQDRNAALVAAVMGLGI